MSTRVVTQNNLDLAVIELRGSLVGGEETDDLKKVAKDLLEQGNRKLVIDLERTDYINSPGIGSLVYILLAYKEKDGIVKLCSLGKHVQNTFVITKLTKVFDIEDTRKQAIQSFEHSVA
jgi:anti-sigma B factor antagonist